MTARKPLRLWPGLVAGGLLILARFIVPLILPGMGAVAILGGLAGAMLVLVWWLFLSRAPWVERVGAVVLMGIALFVTSLVVHESIANGMMGMMLPLFALPFLGLALVAAVVLGRDLSTGRRRALVAAAIVLTAAAMTLIRTGGITGEGYSEIHWRWTPTPEERLLARIADAPAPAPAVPPAAEAPERPEAAVTAPSSSAPDSAAAETPEKVPSPEAGMTPVSAAEPSIARVETEVAEWPGFRGPARDSVIRGVRIETDWSSHPPVEIWRRPIGPGWSSFAVRGDVIYTQEQRGEDELVSSYRLSTGDPVWKHRDAVRFWESNGGPGPRATPTVSGGRVYTLGATGIVNALDARTGVTLWSHNAATDTNTAVPDWGFAGSPLVIDDRVIVAVSGRLVAYDAHSGNLRWIGPPEGGGYSSPHPLTIDGVTQVVLLRGRRATSVTPADGSVLWEDSWQPGVSIVQPAVAENGEVLIAAGDGMGGGGIRRIGVAQGSGGWTIEERWTSRGLKPYFNDFVVNKNHAFGFDGSILACINLADGERKWKGGRYGHGQLLLLPDQDALLVLSEEGELALVNATPDRFTELARFKAIEGKTWNHPVLVGDILLVRNGEEMAAFRLATR